jgi:hypothetical protein
MFERIQQYVVVMAAILSTGYVLWCMKKAVGEFKSAIKKYRGRKLVAMAREIGPWLYYNEVDHVAAVCRVTALWKALESQKNLKPWEPLKQVWVKPTFTFCNDDSHKSKMHIVATRDEVRAIIGDALVEKITGYSRGSVDKASYEKASNLLVCRNSQLFVPFLKDLSDEEGQKQVAFYGSTPTLREVQQYLAQFIPVIDQ